MDGRAGPGRVAGPENRRHKYNRAGRGAAPRCLPSPCRTSIRFSATADPLSFVLPIDEGFNKAMKDPATPAEVVLLSGYQMLSAPLQGGGSGLKRIDESWKDVAAWKEPPPGCMV